MLFKKLSISLVVFLTLLISIFPISAKELYIGGDSIGIDICYDGVLITGTYPIIFNGKEYDPSQDGFLEGSLITHVNSIQITNIKELMNEIEKNANYSRVIYLTIIENNETKRKELHFQNNNGHFSTGLYVSDGITGIGTMTYYNPDNHRFGALGHIMSSENLSFDIHQIKGFVYHSTVTDIVKSQKGKPGEKVAEISNVKIGDITLNNHYGLYGDYYIEDMTKKTLYETAKMSEIKKGPAYFYTVINDDCIEKFEIEIIHLRKQKKSDIKGITFKITDKRLMNNTKGIVQGMSGSPIIQNNKLIGCITHVDIQNPQIGYGLYIEWMLENDK